MSDNISGKDLVFLSHNIRADGVLVNEFGDFLREIGKEPWICTVDIELGSSWQKKIAKAVKNSSHFFAFVSEAWLKSEECQSEYNYAHRLNKTTGIPVIVPVIRDWSILSLYPSAELMMANYNGINADHYGNWKNDIVKIFEGPKKPDKEKEDKLYRKADAVEELNTKGYGYEQALFKPPKNGVLTVGVSTSSDAHILLCPEETHSGYSPDNKVLEIVLGMADNQYTVIRSQQLASNVSVQHTPNMLNADKVMEYTVDYSTDDLVVYFYDAELIRLEDWTKYIPEVKLMGVCGYGEIEAKWVIKTRATSMAKRNVWKDLALKLLANNMANAKLSMAMSKTCFGGSDLQEIHELEKSALRKVDYDMTKRNEEQ